MIGRRLQQYVIVEKAGEGGMGVVWRARDTRLDRDVALKVLPDRFTDELGRERFAREAKSASALNHPNIVTIYEIDSDAGVDFIAMEFIRGDTLAHRLANGALAIPEAIDYATHIADALACAHDAGIIHRDLKPGNIMIMSTGTGTVTGTAHVKVLDFGLAKGAPPSDTGIAETPTFAPLTMAGLAVGTPDYMSPEQALGAPVDARSDVFSFGVVSYQMLTGTLPFRGSSRSDLLRQLHFNAPVPIQTLRPDVPPALVAIVAKALEKKPENRYPSMRAVRHALAHLDRAPISAPAPARARVRRWRAAVILGAIAASLGWGLLSLYRVVLTERGTAATTTDAPLSGSPYELTQRAAQLLARVDRVGNVDDAIRSLEAALKADQNFALAHAYFSEAYRRKNLTNPDPQWVRLSAEGARRALELNPDLAVAHVAQGYLDFDAARYGEAEAQFRRAAELDPLSPHPHIGLGLRFSAEKRDGEAEAALRRGQELKGADWRPDAEMGLFRFRRGRFADAAAGWEASRALAPDNVIVLRNLGAAYHQLGRYDEAAAALQRALEVAPTAAIYTNLGTTRFFQGRYADAAPAFEKAVELAANNSLYWGNLGDAYRWAPGRRADSLNAYTRAIAILREDLARKPEDADLKSRLATYLVKANQVSDAVATIAPLDRAEGLTPAIIVRLTVVHELAGNRGRALELVARALKAGYPAREIANEPELTALRADARYHRAVAALPP
jgi:tetratricopeptide (TPR) repeat protein